MSLIIVEGVVATGKSTLIEALTKHSTWAGRPTRSVISEHYTERVLELTNPSTKDRVALLEQHLVGARFMCELWDRYRFSDDRRLSPAFIFERFHLTHSAQVGDFNPFVSIDQEICRLGGHMIFLFHPRELLLARILRTEHARNPQWQRWLRSLGTERQIEDYFLTLQDRCLSFLSESRIPFIVVEAYSEAPHKLAEKVLNFSGTH